MAGLLRTERYPSGRRRGELRAGATPKSNGGSVRRISRSDDRLLAPIRRHPAWTFVGLFVALVAAITRFVAIGILPPSIKVKPFAHAEASTQVVLGNKSLAFGYSKRDPNDALSTRTYALADMVDSPEITDYVARAAGLPASKIGVLGPVWTELWRSQQWPSGAQRDRQILIEKDPYQITINQESTSPGAGPGPGSGPPVIDVQTQAPTTQVAARLATAVPVGLGAYLKRMQASAGIPQSARYNVRQLVPVSIVPAHNSQLANVAIFTFIGVFVLWCGAQVGLASLMRDLRATTAGPEAGASCDRSSGSGPVLAESR